MKNPNISLNNFLKDDLHKLIVTIDTIKEVDDLKLYRSEVQMRLSLIRSLCDQVYKMI